MDKVFIVGVFCFLIVQFLGFYVFQWTHKKHENIKFYYLMLSGASGLWILISSSRYLIPIDFHYIAPNWTLFPVIFVPFLANRLTQLIINNSAFPLYRRIVDFCILTYLVFSCLSLNMIEMENYGTSTYKPLLAYHILIIYALLYSADSIMLMSKTIIRSSGAVRVRSTLFAMGTVSGLVVSILFVYVFPFFGIFKGYLSALGLIPAAVFWSIAILQYDVFQTRSMILRSRITAKRKLPLLIRMTLKPVLGLHFLLDPLDYRLQLRNSRAEVVSAILQYHMTLQENSGINHRTQMRRVTSFFERYFK
ncbi:LIC10906 family membrane protein [Leptospira yasudae]|uniref:Histidine kinase N-terminal 7TM region domain-containing protein n=1 Tax=Leptospira yasudae TaxID=2202201 RepID=A0A6N4QKB1_9LEPT|nr:hypothetical protein [Leptospira yasudae]TGL81449.1 hypothetical protein EHQ72_05915 [Leptospira yasudae]TGL81708.1 hypothetical protein EHQ77_06445 [Leptospira yasudae]TGL88084.1 hypothetical protein EHQ83_03805 [Leptospira yasudae]